jgi:predicted O-methyltransferase YrrM
MIRSATDYLLDKAEGLLDPETAARARHALGSPEYFNPFGGPMNGQTARLEATRQIIFRCGIRQIVETGTYRGTTTEWLAGFGLPVVTIESYIHSYQFAKVRLRSKPNVRIELGSSVSVLPAVTNQLDTSLPTLFYLDAHWESYLPLGDELKMIMPQFRAPVVLIDDFEVPGESGYAYDDYGAGKALTREYLDQALPTEAAVFYPSTPAAQETGCRRGWVVVTANPDMAGTLNSICLLKRDGA